MRPAFLAAGGGVLVGVAIGYAAWSGAEPVPASSPQAAPATADLAGNVEAQLARLQQEHDELRQNYEELQAVAERQRLALTSADVPAAVFAASEPALTGIEPLVSFGAWAREPALRTADWVDMGIRARDVVSARGTGIGGRQPAMMAALEKKAIRELGDHLDRIAGERPELAGHPVVVVNLMASHLEQMEKPFEPWQIEQIDSLGRQYETQAARMREDMARDDALPSEQKLRSIQLRKNVVDRIVAEVLTRDQWDLLFDAETKGLCYYDVYQVGGLELERPNSSVYWRNVRADAAEHLRSFLVTEWEVSLENLARVDGLVEQWIDAILALPKAPGHPSSAMHIDEILPCVEVHIEFQKRVLESLAGDAEQIDRIRKNTVYAVFPQLRA